MNTINQVTESTLIPTITPDHPYYPTLSKEDQDKLVLDHRRAAYWFARRYTRGIPGVDLDDVASHIMVVFIKAAKSFKPGRNVSFIAYNSKIKHIVYNYLRREKTKGVRVPHWIYNTKRGKVRLQELEAKGKGIPNTISLDFRKTDRYSNTHLDPIDKQYKDTVEHNELVDNYRMLIDRVKKVLDKKSLLILELAYPGCLSGNECTELTKSKHGTNIRYKPVTDEEIAKVLGCTRQWITIKRKSALDKLKEALLTIQDW